MAESLPPPSDRPPPVSFRDVVVRPSIPINENTELKIGDTFKGEPALIFSQDEFSKLAAPFDLVLIGKFTNSRPNMEFLRRGFRLIGFKGDVSLDLLNSHHVLLRFAIQEDY